MISSDPNPAPSSNNTVTNLLPIGSVAPAFRSGDAYKAVGELVLRSVYTALSTAFPRNGSVYSFSRTMPTTANWYCFAYGNGVMVAIAQTAGGGGLTNIAAMSPDGGATWYQTTMPASKQWSSVTFGNGLFVAVSRGTGTVATSPDGVTWTSRTITGADWTSVTYGMGLFVAVASSGTASASSPDGITWTDRTLPTSNNWGSVVFNGTVFIANINSTTTSAASSANGTTWTARTMPVSCAWLSTATNPATGLTVALGDAGQIATTTDGVTWTSRGVIGTVNGGSSLKQVVFGNGVFIAIGAGLGAVIFTSYDGISWTPRTGPPAVYSNAIGYGAGIFVVLGTSSAAVCAVLYAENITDSDYLYLSGTAGQFIRVK